MPAVNRGANPPPTGGLPPPNRLPPPLPDAAPSDGGPHTGPDVGVSDGAVSDARAPDAAQPDAGPASTTVDDCALVMRLASCAPCPVAALVAEAAAERCVVPYVPGQLLTAYGPSDCAAACDVPPEGLLCEAPPIGADCVEGACRALR